MPTLGRKAEAGKQHVQSVLFSKPDWDVQRARAWLTEHDYYTKGLDETNSTLRFRQYDPDASAFRYRSKAIEKGITLVIGYPKGADMALNYEAVKNEDGTYTLKDVEVLQLGRWRGRGTGDDGMEFGDAEVEALLKADEEVRSTTSIRPVLKEKHRNPLTGEDGQILGFLGPLKRAGEKLVADIKQIPETVFETIKSGRAGWLSPDILIDWKNGATGTVHKLFMRAVSFTGGALPAMQTLKPLTSLDFDAEALEREVQLEHLVGETRDAEGGEPAGSVSLGDRSTEEDHGTEGGTEMSEKTTDAAAQALREKEAELAAKEKRFAEEVDARTKELREAELKIAWTGIVGKRATPAEEKTFMAVGMALESDEARKAHIESYNQRPEIEQKKTSAEGGGDKGEEEKKPPFAERVFAAAEKLISEQKAADFPTALAMVEATFTEADRTDFQEWHAAEFKAQAAE